MVKKTSHYQSAPKRIAVPNPIVLGARATGWLFWGAVALAVILLPAAIYWLLTHT